MQKVQNLLQPSMIETKAEAPSTLAGGRLSNFSISGNEMSTCDLPALRRSATHGAPFALLRCHVTNLAEIERTHGPVVTRNAMSALSERLTQRLRSADTVTRSHPDAFTVIAEDLGDAQDAAGVAYRLLASVVEDVAVDGRAVGFDMVIGISVGDGDGDPDRLTDDATRAVEDARADGIGSFRMIDTRTSSSS